MEKDLVTQFDTRQDSLEVDVFVDSHHQSIGDKVILHSGVNLDNVTPLTPHVQVVNLHVLQPLRTCPNGKRVRPTDRHT